MPPPLGYASGMLPGSSTSTWLDSPLGRALLEREREAMAEALETVFGVECLQVGAWGPPGTFLDMARTQRRALLAGPAQGIGSLTAYPSRLPVQADSIDALILPHTLEHEADPHAVLREAHRVLRAEGHVLALGFEPLGPWAWRGRLSRRGFPPGTRRRMSRRRLTDWMQLLGFDVDPAVRFLYTLPFAGAQQGRLQRWSEALGQTVWPRLSGAYLLVARKRVYSVTPLRLPQRARPALIGGLVEPTTRIRS